MINTVFKLNHSVYSKEDEARFKYTSKELNLISDLETTMKNAKGVYVLGGLRGVGKSSILESSLCGLQTYNIDDKQQVILKFEVPFIKEKFNMEILKEIEKVLSHLSDTDTRILTEIKLLIKKMAGNIENSREYAFESQEMMEGGTECESGINLDKGLKFGLMNHLKFKDTNQSSQVIKRKETYSYSFEQLKNDYFNLIKDISNSYDVIMIIDELDKLPANEIGKFLEENKILLLTSNILTILICNKSDAFYLENNYNDYVNDFIYYNNLSITEFIVKIKSLELETSIAECKKLYYGTLGNQREIIKEYFRHKQDEKLTIKANLLYTFMNTDYFQCTNDVYKDILTSFFKEIIEHLSLFSYLHYNELEIIKANFIDSKFPGNYKVTILLDRLLEYLKNNMTLSHRIVKYFIFSDRRYAEVIRAYYDKVERIDFSLYDDKNNTLNLTKFLDYMKLISNETSICCDILQNLDKNYYSDLDDFDEKIMLNDLLPNHYFSNNKPITILNQGNQNNIENAIEKLKMHRYELVGFIMFEPYNPNGCQDSKPLYNGYIITEGKDSIIALSYTGFPGLTSHKKYKIKVLLQYIKENNINAIRIHNDNRMYMLWEDYFLHYDESSEAVNDFVAKHFLRKWVEVLKCLSLNGIINPENDYIQVIK